MNTAGVFSRTCNKNPVGQNLISLGIKCLNPKDKKNSFGTRNTTIKIAEVIKLAAAILKAGCFLIEEALLSAS